MMMGNKTGRPPRWARAARFISTVLLLAGALLLVAAGGLQAYSIYAQTRWEQEQQTLTVPFTPAPVGQPEPMATETETETATPVPTATITAQPLATSTESGATPADTARPQATATALLPTPTASQTPRPTSSPTPRPTATPPPDDRSNPGTLSIPKLNVTQPIVYVPLVNGQWNIDKIIYQIALLGGTGFPGRPGNAVLSAHVTLKLYGNGPFRWLEKLAPGDAIIVNQGNTRYFYRVQSSRTVAPTDVSVLAPTENATLTLITCIDWDYLKLEYMHRLVVTADLSSQQTLTPTSQ
jgi:LPXTG-site transpeptidase (sortase) family protein